MRKISSLLFTLLSFFAIIGSSLTAKADTVSAKIGNLYYSLNPDTKLATVTYEIGESSSYVDNYLDLTGEVDVPASVVYDGDEYSVAYIGENAFRCATQITKVNLPQSLIAIDLGAFKDCTGLESISIPGSVTTIGYSTKFDLPFAGCTALKYVKFEDGTEPVKLASKYYYSSGSPNTPGTGMFADSPLEEVYIGRDFEYFNHVVNSSSTILYLLYIKSFGYSPFYGAACSTLKKATISQSVTSLTKYLFYQCTALETIDNQSDSFTELPEYFCYNCSSLKSLRLSDATTTVGQYAFYGATSLADVSLGNSLTKIEQYAFRNASALTSVELPATTQQMGVYAFAGSGLESFVMPESMGAPGDYAFGECTNLKSFVFNDVATAVCNKLFYKCTSLESVHLGNGITIIEDEAFRECSSLKSLTIPASVTNIGGDIEYPNADPGESPFYWCFALAELRFEDSETPLKITSIYKTTASSSRGLFAHCPLTTIYLGRDLKYRDSLGKGYAYNGYSPFHHYDNGSQLTTVTFGNRVTSLLPYLFYECNKLQALDMSNTKITEMPEYLCYKCSSLASVKLPNTTTSVEAYAFAYNSSLSELKLSTSLKTIANYGFAESSALNIDLEFPEGLTGIGANAFYKSGLTGIVLPNSLTSLDKYYFGYCSSMQSVYIGDGITEIPAYAFTNNTKLTSLHLGNAIATIGSDAFFTCSKLPELVIPASVTEINTRGFAAASGLKSIRFEDGDQPIKLYALYQSSSLGVGVFSQASLTELYIGRDIENVGSESSKAFNNYVSSYGYSPFYYANTTLSTVTIGSKVTTLPQYLFYSFTKLGSIICLNESKTKALNNTLPSGLYTTTRIYVPEALVDDYKAAAYWTNFSNILPFIPQDDLLYLPTSDTAVAVTQYPFTTGSQAIIPASVSYNDVDYAVTSLADNAFRSASELSLVDLPETLTSLGAYSFKGCNAIEKVRSRNDEPPTGSPAFEQNVLDDAELYVATGCVDTYASADVWKEFGNIYNLSEEPAENPSGVEAVEANALTDGPLAVYSLTGIRMSQI